MKTAPTFEDLAAIAAKLDPKLSPDEAIERAQALWAAANKALPATQIADEEEERKLRVKTEILERVGLNLWDDEGISLSQAFRVQQDIASRVGVSPYKTEKRFAAALRKAGLTNHRDISGEWLIPAGSTFRVWREIKESKTPGPGRETQELTSERAVKELFDQRVEQRRKRDRERKAAGKTPVALKQPKKNFKKIPRNLQAQKAERQRQEAEPGSKKRKRQGKKRKPKKARQSH
jgi:hypothetical protein